MMIPKKIPCEKCLDHTCLFLKEGYMFLPGRIKRYGSNLFETRLLGKKVICMSGREAARLFYRPELFKRNGALPKRVQKTLFGVGAIQTMDGRKHLQRKKFFQAMLNQEQQERLVRIMLEKWGKAARRWENAGQIILFDEVNKILCQTVCEWAKVPLPAKEERGRTEDFCAMVNDFLAIGPKYWQGKMARKRTEKWLESIIRDTRCGMLKPEESSVLYQVAHYSEDGRLLEAKMAAVELINLLRPIIAISRYITFMALALEENEEYREKLLSEDTIYSEMFVQEVRRYYPFAPCLGAIVRKNFKWKGCRFMKGRLVLLDLYGTNHDPHMWERPNQFDPEHFRGKEKHLFDFIPQGGGSASCGHRCPGEGVTIELMKASLFFLLNRIEYEVPVQNLNYNLRKIPTLPQSGFVMSHIKYQSSGRLT